MCQVSEEFSPNIDWGLVHLWSCTEFSLVFKDKIEQTSSLNPAFCRQEQYKHFTHWCLFSQSVGFGTERPKKIWNSL